MVLSRKARFNNALLNGVASQASNVMNAELVHEPLPVSLNGLYTDFQVGSNLFVALALGDQLEHLHLAGGQKVSQLPDGRAAHNGLAITSHHSPGNVRAEKRVALFGLADSSDHVGESSLLQQVTRGTGFDQLVHVLIIAVGRQD